MSLYDDLDKDVAVIREEMLALANKPPPAPKKVENKLEEEKKNTLGN